MILDMKNTNTKIIAFILLLFLSLLFISTAPKHASAAYDGGRLIDDNVFLNSTSMSPQDIQSFLTARGGAIANRSFIMDCPSAGTQANNAYIALGAPCGQTVLASSIIYYTAQVYGVNPRVIIATMQKEQSLITATNPTNRQFVQAMGYGCPTTGSCDDSSNFFWQVDNGTWVLRFHYERARGNMNWWYTSNTWTCGTEKNFYKPNLYPNQNVNFYDEDNVMYRTHYIANAATSAFYCYTPHAYNNPQGLYTRAPYGTVGRYYSGSYNFVLFYELWFGSTLNPSFSAEYFRQSPNTILNRGEAKTIYFDFKNSGTAFWKDDTSTFPGYYPVRLMATNPINRWSEYRHSSWISGSRPTGKFAKVFEGDGVTLSSAQHTVQPGQIARFEFIIQANEWIQGGVNREYFQPVLEGAPNWNLGSWANIDIGIHVPTYKAAYVNMSPYPTLRPNSISDLSIRYKNTGNVAWYDDTSKQPGIAPVVLATISPVTRDGIFSSSWPNRASLSRNFSAVYESDGTTLASNQHIAQPGQIVKFDYRVTANDSLTPGSYTEWIRPMLDSNPTKDIGGSGYIIAAVEPRSQIANFHSLGGYPSLKVGQNSNTWIKYKNSGNTPWYDRTAAPSGISPLVLATTNPVNRASSFIFTNWLSISRPTTSFSAVYESDGTTLASNQHIAQPGQIVKFDISFKVPLDKPVGTYKEYIQPVLEGAKYWIVGAYGHIEISVTQ